jgi:hypothetical protein
VSPFDFLFIDDFRLQKKDWPVDDSTLLLMQHPVYRYKIIIIIFINKQHGKLKLVKIQKNK